MNKNNTSFLKFALFITFCILGSRMNAQRAAVGYEDEFKNIRTTFSCISAKAKTKVKRIGRFGYSFNVDFLFYKKIEGAESVVEMRLHMTTDVLEKVEKEIFIKTGEKIKKISPDSYQDAFFRKETVTTRKSDSDGKEENNYLYYTQKRLEVRYLLSQEVQQEILESKDLSVRIYVDDIPFDLNFSLMEIQELKRLLVYE